jgi:hypothetical protein
MAARAKSKSTVTVGMQGSGTPIEAESRKVDEGLVRCATLVTTFDARAYDPRAVEAARRCWALRMAAEHRSTVVFSQLATQLFEANATLDAKLVMLRMAQDEVRHTETCGQVLIGLGAAPECDFDRNVRPLARHAGCTPEERALRNVVYTTCMSEMVAVARLVDEIEGTTDPFLRDAARRLLADEVLHGQFGFFYLEAWRPWLEAHRGVIRSLERYLRHAFAVIEAALAPELEAPASRGRTTDDERALGLPDLERGREVFYSTMEEAIVPGLERFGIDAGKAWKRRTIAA